MTVESERRAGRQECAITAASGERVTLDLVALVAKFNLSQRTIPLRSTLLNSATTASAAVSSSSSSLPPPPRGAELTKPAAATASTAANECQVCFSDAPVEVAGCGHTAACLDCLCAHARARASGADAAAWIPCPDPGCQRPLNAQVLAHPNRPGWAFPIEWLSRMLTRLPEWAPCIQGSSGSGSRGNGSSGSGSAHSTSNSTADGSGGGCSNSGGGSKEGHCPGGVLVGRDNEGQSVPCPVCRRVKVAKRRAEEPDPEVIQGECAEHNISVARVSFPFPFSRFLISTPSHNHHHLNEATFTHAALRCLHRPTGAKDAGRRNGAPLPSLCAAYPERARSLQCNPV